MRPSGAALAQMDRERTICELSFGMGRFIRMIVRIHPFYPFWRRRML
jgi:hypothetical protein